ncbi:MAG: DUF2304 domain-containing protein [Candidatus Zapsychrus exili]|nr:DUF2304 domain-containing protein [Candidatus Zapsychrus exili]
MNIKILAIVISLSALIFVIDLIRREKLMFKYAFSWIIVSILAVFFSIFDKILFKIAYLLGFQLPSNFIFFSLLSVFVFLSLLITIFLCQQNNRNDIMAQKISLLELEIKKIKEKENK